MTKRAVFLFFLSVTVAWSQADTIPALWTEGLNYMEEADYLRGYEAFTKYLELYPDNAQAYHNRAICLYKLGDAEASCDDLANASAMGSGKNSWLESRLCHNDFVRNQQLRHYYRNEETYPERGYRPIYDRQDSLRGSIYPRRACYDVFFYDLTVKIIPGKKSIEGSNTIWFKGVETSNEIQVDLAEKFTIESISMNHDELQFTREGDAVFITLSVEPEKDYNITIEYSGAPDVAIRPPWFSGFVWRRDRKLNRWVSVTSEYKGASLWWPLKDHLTDRPDSMAINIEAPDKFDVISNGQFRGREPAGRNFLRHKWFVNYPINSYNVTFYMGKYDQIYDTVFTGIDTLPVRYDVMPYNKEKAEKHFTQAADVLRVYSNAFGPFPFPKDNFRMVEAPYEGMEHQTAIAYGYSYSNRNNSITYLNRNYDYIIVHEAAHEWWGNAVAASDYADIWLHEGFATYAEILFIEAMDGYQASINELHNRMQFILNIWPMVQNRNVNENSFVGGDVYNKGAAMIHCFRSTLNNDSLFMNLLRDFNLAFRRKTITTDDFLSYVNDYTKKDYTDFFNKYLYETELPLLKYTYERAGDGIILSYFWSGVRNGFEMPFSITTFPDKKAYRIEATTKRQEVFIPGTESLSFFNNAILPENCPRNGLTYYRTKCVNSGYEDQPEDGTQWVIK